MPDVEIRRPKIGDTESLRQFFGVVIADTFAREGLSEMRDEIAHEIATKRRYLQSDLDSDGADRFFLLAIANETIIGTIEYGPASELIDQCTAGALTGWVEVGTVFVHPDYQRQGVGNLLLNSMFVALRDRGVEEFCLDSGYPRAQIIWKKKFGEPAYLLKDYWGEGLDHMIWRIRTP